MEALHLAAGLWVIGPRGEVLDAEFTEQDLQGAASAAAGVAVKMAPSVSTEAGVPRLANGRTCVGLGNWGSSRRMAIRFTSSMALRSAIGSGCEAGAARTLKA